MASCEKCWGDAYTRSIITGKSQGECYYELLKERENNPCSEEKQAGQFWDRELKIDKRKINKEII